MTSSGVIGTRAIAGGAPESSARLLVLEDEASLARRSAAGTPVAVHVRYDGCSTDLKLSMDLPNGDPVIVEVDTCHR